MAGGFFEAIDEMVLLTNDSYLAHKNYYTILPTRFSVLHNGIDTSKFYALLPQEKESVKESKGRQPVKKYCMVFPRSS